MVGSIRSSVKKRLYLQCNQKKTNNIMNTVYVNTIDLMIHVGTKKKTICYQSHFYTQKAARVSMRYFIYLLDNEMINYKGNPIYIDSYYTESILTDTSNIISDYFTPNYINSVLTEENYFFDEQSLREFEFDIRSNLKEFGFEINESDVALSILHVAIGKFVQINEFYNN